MKTCTRCKVPYPATRKHFRWRKDKNTLKSWCRECENEDTQARYWNTRTKRLKAMKKYQQTHMAVFTAANRRYRRKHHATAR